MRKDWIECKFGEIITFKNGYAFKSRGYLKSGIPVVRIGDIKENKVLIENAICVDENKDLKEYEIVKDDILIAMSGATTGKFGRYNLNDKAYLNQRVGNIKPLSDKYISKSFLYYLLSQLKREIEKSAYGGAQPNISSKKIEELTVALAPLPEQRAIVKKLESLFSSLDAGVADLKKAQQKLKIYRQAVLKKAFEGELTNIKIENLVSIDQNVIVNPRPPKEGFDDEFECQFVPMKLVEALNNKIHLEESAVFNTLKGKSYTYFETGDVIFAKVTPCMENGKIAVAKDLKNGVALGSSEFHVFRCNDELLSEYLFYFIIQDKFRSDAERAMTGAVGLRRVPKKFIEDYEIPLPSIAEQKAIVKQIESRLSVCDSIEQNIKESLEKAEALRQSILKKAFEGNLLTAQELAECKLAEDYEPAGVLLERIKVEHSQVSAA